MPALDLKGYRPDKTSPRFGQIVQPVFSKFAPTLAAKAVSTESEYRIAEFLPCFDQKKWGSCVLNAWVGGLEILRGLEAGSGSVQSLSRAWAYALCQLEMNTFNQDSGTFPFLAADRLMQIGVVPEDRFPYIAANLPVNSDSPPGFMQVHPPGSLYIEASDNKITNAFRIEDVGAARVDAVELAVRADHPVIWGADFDPNALSAWEAGDSALDIPADTSKTEGHSTLITGVQRLSTGVRWFRVRNSWYIDWGDNGYFWITDRYIASQIANDFWVGTRMQGLIV